MRLRATEVIGSASSWSLRSRNVVLPNGRRAATVHVQGGRIAAVAPHGDAGAEGPVFDVGEAAVLPGLVDTHVHINEPGRADWEGFETATLAAAAGGVTTLIEMPLNAIPATTSVDSLAAKVASAHGKLTVDVGFWGGVVPGNVAELEPLWRAGAFGFKCFLVPSGVAEFPHVGVPDLRAALPILARLGAPLLVHAEAPGPIERAAELATCVDWDERRYACYLESRPRTAELEAITLLLELQRETGARIHIVHLAAADAAPRLAHVRRHNRAVTVETCPHYLTFAAEEIQDGATAFKCAPPIRDAANREALWRALREGTIDLVASDHSPCPPALKRLDDGDFMRAWGGIASLQLGASALWTGMRSRQLPIERLAEWMSTAPARLAGLARKGAIAPGGDADLVVFRPDDDFLVSEDILRQRHKVTPYMGRRLMGVVETTILRGAVVFDCGETGPARTGRVLRRGDA